MTIKEALRRASKEIPSKEAMILLSHHLKKGRIYLIAHDDEEMEDFEGYYTLVLRAKNSEPIEYITQSVSFYGELFFIDYGALIPRPETELLVDYACELAKRFDTPKIAEIGVGSGVISIMIAKKFPTAKIISTDISQEALTIAKINAQKFEVEDQIEFVHTPYLNGINEKFDIIVSNPPYIATDKALDKKLSYEPDIALFGGKAGDEVLKEIAKLAKDKTKYLCCEMGYDQKSSMESYLKELGYRNFGFYKDLSGFNRGFIAEV